MAVGKERTEPRAEGKGEAKVMKDMDDVINIDVIEEALNVKENNRRCEAGPDGGLSVVN